MSGRRGARRGRRLTVLGALLAVLLSAGVVPVPTVAAHHTPAAPAGSHDVSPDPGLILGPASETVLVDGDRLLVATGRAGFRRTDNGGRLWHRAMSGYVTPAGTEPFTTGLCQAPSAPAVVYSTAGVGGRWLFRSDDLGGRWRQVAGGTADDSPWADCAVHPSDPDVVYVVVSGGNGPPLLRSTDGGRTLEALGSGLDGLFPAELWVLPTRPETLWLIAEQTDVEGESSSTLYASTDGGHSFTPLAGGPDRARRVFPHPTRDGLVLVDPGAPAGAEYRLLRSTDGGAAFHPVGPVQSSAVSTRVDVAFDPADPSVVYARLDPHGLYRSADAGATFERLPGPATSQLGQFGMLGLAATRSPDGRRHLYVGSERGPYRSDDGGRTFVPVTRTFRAAAVNDLAVDAAGRLMVAVMHTVLAFRARTPGHPSDYDPVGEPVTGTPVAGTSPFSAAAVAPSTVDADTALLVTLDHGVFVTTDSGRTWTASAMPDDDWGRPLRHLGLRNRAAFAPGSATRAYIAAHGHGLFRSDDGGRSFEHVSLRGALLSGLAVDPRDPDVVYLAARHGFESSVYTSVDGGRTVVGLGVPGGVSGIALDAGDARTLYVAPRDGGVLRSRDRGATWEDAGAGLPAGSTLAIASDPLVAGRVYAWVRTGGLYVSTDHGRTWQAADTGEARRRSDVSAGPAAMAVDRRVPGRVYLGNSGVVQVDTRGGRRG